MSDTGNYNLNDLGGVLHLDEPLQTEGSVFLSYQDFTSIANDPTLASIPPEVLFSLLPLINIETFTNLPEPANSLPEPANDRMSLPMPVAIANDDTSFVGWHIDNGGIISPLKMASDTNLSVCMYICINRPKVYLYM